MKTKHILAMILLILTLVLVSAPQPALAQSGGGSGTLTASGDGLAGIRGNGTVTISGSGILWIRDRGGDAVIDITGDGVRAERARGWIRYSGFHGEATISGSQITVALSGFGIEMEATGTGKFVLRGDGSYSVEKDGVIVLSDTWTEEAKVLTLP